MPYILKLSKSLQQAGWKVKIHDNERLEPPHATIYQKSRTWRLSLRNKAFLDDGDKWSQINDDVREAIEKNDNWTNLKKEWNKIHPDNPVE